MNHRSPQPGRVLVVDDHARARESMADILRCAGHQVASCASASEALLSLRETHSDVVVTDLRMPGMSGVDFIQEINRRQIDCQVVMVTAHASVASAVEAMRYGAFDYLEKPISADQLEQLVGRALRRADTEPRPAAPTTDRAETAMIGQSPPMQKLRERIAQVGPTDETVLISGESGVGKELVAAALHASSHRASAPLVSMNCPALSPQLMESELFGHERGAFTSADAPRIGRFQLADGGTIFLDEVTEIDLGLQAKLLRVLQERAFERVGASQTIHVDVRVVATTNRDLQTHIREGRFREDLYFRLAVVPIHVPPLRQRQGDVELLVAHFLEQSERRLNRPPCEFTPSARELLCEYHWPGNVRELENLVTRANVLHPGKAVDADDLRSWMIDGPASNTSKPSTNESADAAGEASASPQVGVSLQTMERRLIEATLQQFDGHRVKTAQALGIGVRTLTNKLRSYGYAPRAKRPA